MFSLLATPNVALIVASAVAVDSAVASVAPAVNLVVVSAEHATSCNELITHFEADFYLLAKIGILQRPRKFPMLEIFLSSKYLFIFTEESYPHFE